MKHKMLFFYSFWSIAHTKNSCIDYIPLTSSSGVFLGSQHRNYDCSGVFKGVNWSMARTLHLSLFLAKNMPFCPTFSTVVAIIFSVWLIIYFWKVEDNQASDITYWSRASSEENVLLDFKKLKLLSSALHWETSTMSFDIIRKIGLGYSWLLKDLTSFLLTYIIVFEI